MTAEAVNDLYPIFIKLAGRPCVVVGGGEVALRKVEGLLAAGARVTAVSPDLHPGLDALHRDEKIAWVARRYLPGDLAGAALAIAAVDDRRVSAAVFAEAEERRIFLNAVDYDPHCSFHVPAVAAGGHLKIAISTGGKCPALASRIRQEIESSIDERLDRALAVLGDLRTRVLALFPDDPARRKAILVALARSVRLGLFAPAALVVSPPAASPLAASPLAAFFPATTAAAGPVSARIERGKVYLVGAGPGDPGLLTRRAAELIAEADEVHHDRLVGPGVVALIPENVRRVFVGKEVGDHDRPDTGHLLVEAARAGKAVVRLKGGDPHVFGRGGEEMLALLKAGVPFEVVPGVSALSAVPAAAGIPITFRGLAREVVIRSGYRREDSTNPGPLPGGSEGTTYIYFMTIGRLTEIAEELLREGLDPRTPVAVIQRGTLPDQRIFHAPLGELVARAARESLAPPALLIAGEVVRFARWKEFLPLLDAHAVGAHVVGEQGPAARGARTTE